MKGHVLNLEESTLENVYFREVLFTAPHSQLVVMSLLPSEDIGEEIHEVDQFIRVEEGNGKAILDDEEFIIEDGFAVMVPAGTKHNILNTSDIEPMKLYTIYSPAEHPSGTVHKTKGEAMAEEEERL